VDSAAVLGEADEVILEQASRERADLIVLGLPRRSRLAALVPDRPRPRSCVARRRRCCSCPARRRPRRVRSPSHPRRGCRRMRRRPGL
jgi:hypothetical protein